MSQTTSKHTVAAVLLIVTGTILLLAQLDLMIIPWFIFTWQFLLIAIGFILIVTKNKWESGATLMAVGTAFLLARIYHISYRDIWQYWPALLIIIGVVMLFRHLDEPKKFKNDESND
ncbi:MAG: DUF5668 domain-containing protein [Cyclobacteriaceae bacterium]|nr:DUF5668 domain-containing protein [Cyclobacteriaceae bacterium]